MSVTTTQLRGDFPALKDPSVFPDEVLNFWLTVAQQMVNLDRWGNLWSLGVELFAAHHSIIDIYNQDTVNNGGIPGLNRGAINSESAGPVNLSYDTAGSSEEGGGHWNLTTYGTRYLHTARLMGAGPIYVGTCGMAPPFNGPAWAGPWTAFTPSMNT